MKNSYLRWGACVVAALLSTVVSSPGATTVQDPVLNIAGTGPTAWSYLLVEGESFESKLNPDPAAGFIVVTNDQALTSSLGNPILRKLTDASGKSALYGMSPSFGEHADKVTYKVQFATAGTYYLYFRFTAFESGNGPTSYGNEDSFFVPPDFGKDPQTDWPTGHPRGGYIEGCCGSGFMVVNDKNIVYDRRVGDAAGRAFWEGSFHWNHAQTSEFLTEAQGTARMRIKYEVTEGMLNTPLDWTIGYRENGLTIDAFLFSTNPDLITTETQRDIDRMVLHGVAVQQPENVVNSNGTPWNYLLLEAENFIAKTAADGVGFIRAYNDTNLISSLGNPILGTNSTASGKSALYGISPTFGEHADKVTYRVQFSTAGTYYLYFRFTAYESGNGPTSYGNEDSFFVPPDFGKDPQTDWPTGHPRGGYIEGCCGSGFMVVNEKGIIYDRRVGDDAGRAFWEGNFHWNHAQTSEFLTEAQGTARMRIKYVVTESMLNKPLDWTIGYRENGLTLDAFLFSTDPDLKAGYNSFELDHYLINPVTEQDSWNTVGEGETAWDYLVLEGEDYDTKLGTNPEAGFVRVDTTAARTSNLLNPILSTNSNASGGGALYALSPSFGEHADKVTYQVQFAKPGTYYLYMRFTVFESGNGPTSYGNEDSFFVPPDFGKDPQTDWPTGHPRGGYVEGCCGSGFLVVTEKGVTYDRRNGDEAGRAYWEGNFHWNKLQTSEFLTEAQGIPLMRISYVVTESMVGKPLEFMIGYREWNLTIDALIFSTNPALMDQFTGAELDKSVLGISAGLELAVAKVGTDLVFSWPTSADGYTLEYADELPATTWTPMTETPTVEGGLNKITIPAPTTGIRFYRLMKP